MLRSFMAITLLPLPVTVKERAACFGHDQITAVRPAFHQGQMPQYRPPPASARIVPVIAP